MGSTTVKRARKGADAEYYEMTAIPSAIHVGADGKVDNDVTIRLWHVKGASRTEVTTASDSKLWLHVGSESLLALDDDVNFPYSLMASNTYLAADVEHGDSYVACTVNGVTADKLIIPIVRDGQGISTADVMFTISITNTMPPLDLQFNDAKQTKTLAKDFFTSDNKDKYLWQGTKVVASDGSVSWTGKICLGKISDLQSSNEEYMLTTSNTDVPPLPGNTGADWNPVFKPKAGYYLWEITKIVYACDSSVSYTTPQCIGYFSKNGVAGAYYQTQYGLSNSRTSHAVVNWKDMMPTPTDDYPYVWQRTRLCTPTESSTTYGDWLYVCLTGEKGDPGIPGEKGDPGIPGEKASYYEARFVNQDFDVRVDNDHLNGVLYAVFDLRVYHVVGSDATEVSGDGVTVNFSFRNADGIEKATGTASYNSTTKLISYSNTSLQDPYFGEKIDRITSCYYSISLPSSMGGSTRDGVISVQFYAPSAFEHSDTLFKSIFAKGSKFSQLVQNVDGIFTRVQRLETNMLMGTTTGLGWTHEKTCAESSYSFDVSTRKFTIINYFPAYRDGITSESMAYSMLKSAVLQVVPGKTYILSFKADVGDKVYFEVGLRYGTTNAVSDASKYYYWNYKKAKHDDKAMEVLVPTKGSDGRYFVVFVAKSGYDYMQVMFINAVDGNNYAVTSSTKSGNSTTINGTWPYSDTKNHTTSSSTTVSKDGAVRTTVSNTHIYTGSSIQYVAVTQTTVETVTPTYLYITEPQLEEATRDNIADIEPSDYKSYQNAVESYIKQTADSIIIKAGQIHLEGYTTINKGFSIDEDGNMTANNMTANNANIVGGRLLIGKDSNNIAIETLDSEPGGVLTVYQGSNKTIRLGISKPASGSYAGSSIYTDIKDAFSSETVAKNVCNGPTLMLGAYHGGGGAVYSFLSNNFFYNRHIDTEFLFTGGLSMQGFVVDDDAVSYNNQPSLAEVDAVIVKNTYLFPSVLLFKNTYAKTFELGDPSSRDTLGLVKNTGRWLYCWHMGGDITFTASVSGKGIRAKSGGGYKDVTSFKSTSKMELVIFYSDGDHWLLTTHNTSMV